MHWQKCKTYKTLKFDRHMAKVKRKTENQKESRIFKRVQALNFQPLKVLDLCCGAGGASLGYNKAYPNAIITGIDNNPELSKVYPFKFICTDAVEYLKQHINEFDFIHASPSCQEYSKSTQLAKSKGKTYSKILIEIRDFLRESNKPYCIENVLQAPIRGDLYLQGNMFNLRVLKKRKFELSFFMFQPAMPQKIGSVKNGDFAQIIGVGQHVSQNSKVKFKGTKKTVLESWREVMQIPYATKCAQLSEAIPPAYTEYIFTEFINQKLLQSTKNQFPNV